MHKSYFTKSFLKDMAIACMLSGLTLMGAAFVLSTSGGDPIWARILHIAALILALLALLLRQTWSNR